MVLKMQPVKVLSVAPTADRANVGAGIGRRVALTLQQPDRHEVFVAPSAGSSARQTMATVAVGSADVVAPRKDDPRAAGMKSRAFGLTVKRTFIDFDDEDDSRPFARSSSCPPEMHATTRAKGVKFAPGSGALSASGPPRLRRVASESDVASVSSRQSSAPTDVDVLVAVTNGISVATVSEMLQAREGGLPSRGSAEHACGNCQVCFFENRHQHGEGPPCFKGALCERCHCRHDLIPRKKRIPGPTRNARRWAARQNQKSEMGDTGSEDDGY